MQALHQRSVNDVSSQLHADKICFFVQDYTLHNVVVVQPNQLQIGLILGFHIYFFGGQRYCYDCTTFLFHNSAGYQLGLASAQ